MKYFPSSFLICELLNIDIDIIIIIMDRMLGKYSTIRKNVREFGELQTHINTSTSGSRKALVMDYYDMLNRHLLAPLINGNVGRVIKQHEGYGYGSFLAVRNNRANG